MRTTKRQFEQFRDEVVYWLEVYGLQEWQVDIEHREFEGWRFGRISYEVKAKHAVIGLNKKPDCEHLVSEAQVRRCAFHEVWELILARMDMCAYQRFGLIEGDVEEAEHEVIRRAENAHWQVDWEARKGRG